MLFFSLPGMPVAEDIVPITGYFLDKIVSYHVYLQIVQVVKVTVIVLAGLAVLYFAYRLYTIHMARK